MPNRSTSLARSPISLCRCGRTSPPIKYLFSTSFTRTADMSVIILLTPRDPAFWDEQYQKSLSEFVEMRRAFVRARLGTEEEMKQFRERYPQEPASAQPFRLPFLPDGEQRAVPPCRRTRPRQRGLRSGSPGSYAEEEREERKGNALVCIIEGRRLMRMSCSQADFRCW